MPTSKVLLALILIVFLAAPTQLIFAQQPAAPAPAAAQPAAPETAPTPPPQLPIVETLKVLILEGDGAINDIDKHTVKVPIVEVRDDNDKPVDGAEVVFRLPVSGPGGTFTGGKSSKTGKTNAQGQLAATGFTINNESGRFDIRVTASSGNRVGQGIVQQTNAFKVKVDSERKKKKTSGLFGLSWKKVAIIGAVAGGVTVAIVLATRGDGNSSPAITITPGPVTIGGR